MPSADTYARVQRIVMEALDTERLPDTLRPLLEIPLRQRGKVFSSDPAPRWPTLVIASAQAARGRVEVAARIAAAVEVFLAAADILDEVQDGDDSPVVSASTESDALNVVIIMLALAQHIIAGLDADGIPPASIPSFSRILSLGALRAAAGQHLDLRAEGSSSISLEEARDIARMKAGSLAGMACRLGAMAGVDDPAMLDLYEQFGIHLGTMAQLLNDAKDFQAAGGKTDALRAKGTLPLLYHRAMDDGTERGENSWRDASTHESHGAVEFAWVVAEIERAAALTIAEKLSQMGQDARHLTALV